MEQWIFDTSCKVTHPSDYENHISWARINKIDLTRPARFSRFEPAGFGRPEGYSVHLLFDTGHGAEAGVSQQVVTHCFKPVILNQSLEDFM